MATKRRIRVLFLGANPSDTTHLALDREVREITKRLLATPYAHRFRIAQEWAVHIDDLQSALLRHRPDIIHFAGHGLSLDPGRSAAALPGEPGISPRRDIIDPASTAHGAILVEDRSGMSAPVTAAALEELLGILGGVRCIMLNACVPVEQCAGLRRQVECIIGMNHAIRDEAAIVFAGAFYQALGFGESIGAAFELGRNQIALKGLHQQHLPELVVREGLSARHIRLLEARDEARDDACDDARDDAVRSAPAPRDEVEETEARPGGPRDAPRSGSAPWSGVISLAGVAAGAFIFLLLLLIPRDVLIRIAPAGTPQLVLGVMALAACTSWSLHTRRHSLCFAPMLIAMLLLAASRLGQLAFGARAP